MDVRGVYLWMALCVLIPKDMLGHRNEALGAHRWSLWVGIRSCHTHKMHAKTTTHDRGTDGHGVDGRVNGT